MHRISSVEEFSSFCEQVVQSTEPEKPCLVISAGTCGQASGANDIMRMVKKQILERNLQEKLHLRVTGCQGFCDLDPCIVVEPYRHLYARISMDDVPQIIDAALEGIVVEDLLYRESAYHDVQYNKDEIPFFKRQTRLLLAKNEKVDPIRLFHYIEQGGYGSLAKVLSKSDPDWVIAEIKRSGLRGRGGAGFPTGIKWGAARAAKDGEGQKYLICNADEGDPGAYMDRSLLEGNPHAVIEGMLIAGIAIGATKGIVYVRAEYPLAIKHTLIALRQAADLGLLGENILGSGYDFDIDIVRGAGAFVCGEETALIRSIEGSAGEPKQRPPFPVQRGLWGKPTCINNVETLSNVPVIFKMGADAYARIGVTGNSGTKIFSVVGKIRNTGLVEVPMGTTISEIVYDIGGGPLGKSKLKAVQTGGPSGGCIPAHMFDLPIDYDSLSKVGSIMGSGGMIVMDEHSCMVDIAKYYMAFLRDESCGKCFSCRKGTQRMYEILDDISSGRGTLDQLELLEELAHVVSDTSMCGLGQTAPNPVLSTLRYFREEYVEHIHDKRCRAGVCDMLVGAPCQAACPIDTEAWRYIAHIGRGEYDAAYRAIRQENPFPSVCARVCDHKCEERCRLGLTGERPVAIRALKRFVTDNTDPSVYEIPRADTKQGARIAIVGAGPAGLTAAHYLSMMGYRSTVFEAEDKPGGMLLSCIPPYRLPHGIIEKEIDAILDDNVTLKCNTALGRDITVDGLLSDGYSAVFLAAGAQASRRLKLDNEDAKGVYPAVEFLKAFNLEGRSLAKGRVAVIGGGNSAIDAARTALRQEDVDSVTVLYRRTREEMPAFEEEIEAAIEEGIDLQSLVTPVRIDAVQGALASIDCLRNRLGDLDASGRRRPVPMEGTEFSLGIDTLLVAISEQPDVDSLSHGGSDGLKWTRWGTLDVDEETLACSRDGVFAGGDVVTGPNTVVDAIAAGKRVSRMIDRYIRGEELRQPSERRVPSVYVEPHNGDGVAMATDRIEPPHIAVDRRQRNFDEVERVLSESSAMREARRCLRCDLEFTCKTQAH